MCSNFSWFVLFTIAVRRLSTFKVLLCVAVFLLVYENFLTRKKSNQFPTIDHILDDTCRALEVFAIVFRILLVIRCQLFWNGQEA